MLKRGFFAACGMMLPFAAFGQVLWDQEPNPDGLGFASDGISTNGSQYYQEALADNFTLSGASNVTNIEFWGSSDDTFFPDLTNFSAFDIYIYDPSFNVVYSTQVSTASLTPVYTGVNSAFGGQIYSFNLATNINLAAGNYELHVGSINVAPQGDGFVWADSVSGDNLLYANIFNGQGWNTESGFGDLAFKLSGSPAPEPASIALLGLGVVALIRRKRR
ncbi:MAG TPA: PEP-CTERM sorting domain-containing protein [Fimbriimonadaceae bacterium]|nr:PEP-CTERM sorting domain-containing protein [Fimbriimonadaceae bacterium]